MAAASVPQQISRWARISRSLTPAEWRRAAALATVIIVLHVLARELDADLDPDDFDHVAVYDREHDRIEMRLRARRDLVVPLLGLEWRIAAGEEILTETSAKFRVEGLRDELAEAGFEVVTTWTDEASDFSLTLATRA